MCRTGPRGGCTFLFASLFFILLSIGLAFSGFALSADLAPGSLNDLAVTPGDVRTTDKASICHTKTTTLRKVSAATHKQAFKNYGITNKTGWCNHAGTPPGCEVDHLISLELGGTNDIKNLWPQPYAGIEWHAKLKDALENKLHKMICEGSISAENAQNAIATDWIKAYKQYIEEPADATQDKEE